MPETILVQTEGAALHITLNRPEVHNAMNDQMAAEIAEVFAAIQDDRAVRAVVIRAAGKTFSSGGDLGDLQRDAELSAEERVANLMRFDAMLRAIDEAPQVTLAVVQGAALGGGFGLVCCADIALAGEAARFGLPEARLGLSPALISPYVIARLGLPRARALMLTGGHLTAAEALAAGLVNEVLAAEQLAARAAAIVGEIMACAPGALAATKALIHHVTTRPRDESLRYRAELIDRLRYGAEGQEGMLAFLQKRKPAWAEQAEQAAGGSEERRGEEGGVTE
jgi:enoyl-CoA hydratase/carnithine racemase